jgi:predicted unusual protein kinase regulating ubiquinone biosynthesis (AarF/ABC1/UbiB family)
VANDKMPTSRVGRTAKIGGLAAGQAIRQAGTMAANVGRSEEGRQVALERRHIEAAEQIVTALGTMKGAAMKVGQVMSFLDVGLVPEEYREEFQRKLGALRDAAPTVTFKDMRKVIEAELGERLRDVFTEFDEQPVAAASIGQVYRAVLTDGREVAVKVQYPGVAAAVRADMQNLGLILRLVKRIAPGMDPKTIGEEIRARIHEELDYELEAQNQRALARIFRGHPFIVIPEVVTSLSRERVMVSDFVRGIGFEDLKNYPQDQRDRVGEIMFRFYFGCLYRHGQFSGDPHPGNSMLLDDGRLAFYDFGLFKRMPPGAVELEIQVARAIIEGDSDTIMRLPQPREVQPRPRARPLPGSHLLVHVRPRDRAHARLRHPGADRHERPALGVLRLPAPGVRAARPHLRPAHGGADAGGHLPAALARQLPPDRARVVLQRPAGHRARRAGGRVLRRLSGGGRGGCRETWLRVVG